MRTIELCRSGTFTRNVTVSSSRAVAGAPEHDQHDEQDDGVHARMKDIELAAAGGLAVGTPADDRCPRRSGGAS
jgi:hypothetical protein